MRKNPWNRIMVCGLLAGFVANLLQLTVNRIYLLREWERATGVARSTSGGFPSEVAIWLAVVNFAGGILAMWLYSMARSRYGSGPGTAALAGTLFWLLGWVFPITMWTLSGTFPEFPLVILAVHLGTYLGIAILETLAGASIYQESEPASRVAATA